MRITITLDDDAMAIAREQADKAGLTLGQAVSLLIRRSATVRRKPIAYPGNFQPLPERPDEPKVTLELVNQLRDEE